MRRRTTQSAAQIAGSRDPFRTEPLGREWFAAGCAAVIAELVHAAVVGPPLRALVDGVIALALLDVAMHRPASLGRGGMRLLLFAAFAATLGYRFHGAAFLERHGWRLP